MPALLIAGGGIAGMAAALACSARGARVELFERADKFAEFGAGIQLGPNAMRVLYAWGLQSALADLVAWPERLQVCCANSGRELGVLRLGSAMRQRYAAPYATIHRADLHALLLRAVQQIPQTRLQLGSSVSGFTQQADAVAVRLADGRQVLGAALLGADGGFSQVRQQMLSDGVPKPTGYLAYRALLSQTDLPPQLRSQQVTLWLGADLHVVAYPVRSGTCLNVVAIVAGTPPADLANWDHSANVHELQRALGQVATPLQDLLRAVPTWRLWPLSMRRPMGAAHEHAIGRVALLGDAAHPMLPYLAQGAAMAIEDAQVLAQTLAQAGCLPASSAQAQAKSALPAALQKFARQRWQRNAQVQARALRNGKIFHASGALRWARNNAMRVLGESLLDQPWLYAASG